MKIKMTEEEMKIGAIQSIDIKSRCENDKDFCLGIMYIVNLIFELDESSKVLGKVLGNTKNK